nr:type II toxin-antitoxin system YafQ family toxin [Magnetococcus marinus]
MSRIIQTTKAFEKDLKKAKKRGKDLGKLKSVIDTLASGEPLASRFRPPPSDGQLGRMLGVSY